MIRRKIWLLAVVLLAAPSISLANLRNYIDAYGPETMGEGQFGFEFRNEFRVPDRGNDYFHSEAMAQIGVTDRYTVGVAGIFREGLGFTAAKVENRYRLTPIESWPVDTAVYLAFKDANAQKDNDQFESKLILSKDIQQWNFTGNGIMNFVREFRSNGDDEWDVRPGLALGASFRNSSIVTPGVEMVILEFETRIVPAVFVALAPHVRFNVGLSIGLEHHADNAQVKSLLQIEF